MSLIKDPSLSMSLTLKLCLCPFNCFHVSASWSFFREKEALSPWLSVSSRLLQTEKIGQVSYCRVWPEEVTSSQVLGPAQVKDYALCIH